MTVFSNASPMLSDVTDSTSRDGEVHDAALVRIERADLLRQAGVLAPLPPRNSAICLQLIVLALAIAHAVDDEAAAFRRFVAEDRGDDVLQRGERFALPANQHVAVLAGEVDAEPSGISSALGLEVEVHARRRLFCDERGDVRRCRHSLVVSTPSCFFATRFRQVAALARSSAGQIR